MPDVELRIEDGDPDDGGVETISLHSAELPNIPKVKLGAEQAHSVLGQAFKVKVQPARKSVRHTHGGKMPVVRQGE